MESGYYPVLLIEERNSADGSVSWLAMHPTLPGCHAVGPTQEVALARLDEVRSPWLEWAASHKVVVRPPLENPSVTVRYVYLPSHSASVETGGEEEVQQTNFNLQATAA